MLGLLGLLGAVFAGAVIEGISARATDEEDEAENADGQTEDQAEHGNLLDDPDQAAQDDPLHLVNPFRTGGTHGGGWIGSSTNTGSNVSTDPGGSDSGTDVPGTGIDSDHDPDTGLAPVDGPQITDPAPGTAVDPSDDDDTDTATPVLPGSGSATETGSSLSSPASGTARDDLLDGGDNADLIRGGEGNDQINARDGDDTIYGDDGNDIVTAGAGNDLVFGGAGNDELHGDAGDDTLEGGAGDDQLMGHEGDDLLRGGAGNDTLLGGEGDDSLYGEEGDDWLWGGEGDDQMVGGAGADTLDGGAGNDTLWGAFPEGDDGEVDFLNGGDGDDVIHLGAGDYGNGGAGSDSFVLTQWLGEGGFATITDYDPQDDEIVLVYDPAAHVSPAVSVTQSATGGSSLISIDGFVVAEVNGQVNLSEIRLLAA
ncbi:calcium-binding protein [Paracoccus sp. IB05]|uniref:calcium-binding protein n=1 Tax=Paracoccus sp. IB05 TaxID=2779367 RepID=UPI0018E8025D|nr:calcium-binding protein [Paracoccus sp. IB05]MBJ2150953.1 calcium-binding protein [Paracoccus sp. IB05]